MHMATVTDITRTPTIAEATDLTCKAIPGRVDRGTIRAVLRDGVRRIPHSERARTGLLDPTGEVVAAPAAGSRGAGPPQDSPGEAAAVVGELLDPLERQAGEVAELRPLTRRAESPQLVADQERDRAERLEGELHELHARLAATEGAGAGISRRRWRRGSRAAAAIAPSRGRTAKRRAVGDGAPRRGG